MFKVDNSLVHLFVLSLVFVFGFDHTESQTTWKEPTGCPEAFKGKCRCGQMPYGSTQRLSYVTNCTNTNFTDVSMLTQLSPETEVLIFVGNNVTSLPQNLIGLDAKYEKLHTIDLSNNHIKFIRGKTFHNVKTVKVLNLSYNQIIIDDDSNFHPRIFSNFKNLEELHLKNSFDSSVHDFNFMDDLWTTFNQSELTSLKVLDLDDNHISSFSSDDMFCVLPSLQKLHFAYNSLTDFNLNLTCLKDLNFLDISYNFITTLSNRSLEYLESGPPNYHINLTMNSFRCDCHLIDFFLWAKTSGKIGAGQLEKFRCVYGPPMDNAGKYLNDLSEMDLECSPSIRNDDFTEYISISYAILTSLIITLCILLAILVFINRQYLISSWTYLTTGIVAKREYTSLSQDKQVKRHNQSNQQVAEVEV